MKNETTKIWIDGQEEKAVEVAGNITDLDVAARLLGYSDYLALRLEQEGVESADELDEEDEVLNFKWTSHMDFKEELL